MTEIFLARKPEIMETFVTSKIKLFYRYLFQDSTNQ